VPPAASAPRSTAAAGAHGPAPAASPWPGLPLGAPPGPRSPPACPAAAPGTPAASRAPAPLADAIGPGPGSAAWPRTCRAGGAPPSRGAAPSVSTAPCSASAAETATSSRASSPTATCRRRAASAAGRGAPLRPSPGCTIACTRRPRGRGRAPAPRPPQQGAFDALRAPAVTARQAVRAHPAVGVPAWWPGMRASHHQVPAWLWTVPAGPTSLVPASPTAWAPRLPRDPPRSGAWTATRSAPFTSAAVVRLPWRVRSASVPERHP